MTAQLSLVFDATIADRFEDLSPRQPAGLQHVGPVGSRVG
jgi:hypothetical protein